MPFPPFISVRTASRTLPPIPLALLLPALLLTAILLVSSPASAAKGPEPPERIPLEPLGFQNVSSRYLLSGATMFTLHYVDNQHLLVTFGVTRLMRRLPECPPEDEDRTVAAVLLELPSGRELARTEWRFHDVGQYLWDLGDGQFLLRQRDTLTTFAPLAQLASGHPFQQHPFHTFDQRIDVILISPDHSLLSVETSKGPTPEEKAAQAIASQNQAPPANRSQFPTLRRHDPSEPKPDPNPNRVQISFIRLIRPQTAHGSASESESGPPLRAQLAGTVRTRQHLQIPLTAEGFLRSTNLSDTDVNLYFATFAGKVTDLGEFPTSCPPAPTFISPSEFVAFGCRGSENTLELAGFNVRGDFMWQLNFSDSQAYPSFVSAVSANRFAFSRTVTIGSIFNADTPASSQLVSQEVRVLQTYNGKQLLKVETSPIQRAGQNFALSPDGLALAVIHDPGIIQAQDDGPSNSPRHAPAIEIYALPSLSEKDRQQVRVEASLAPPPTELPIQFTIREVNKAAAEDPASPTTIETDPKAALVPENTSVASATSTAASSAAGNASNQSAAPDQAEESAQVNPPAHRKPPSLYAPDPDTSSSQTSQPAQPSQNVQTSPSNPAAQPSPSDPPAHRKPPSLYAPDPNAPSSPDSPKPPSSPPPQ